MWERFDIAVACEQTLPGSSGALVLCPTTVPQRPQESLLAGYHRRASSKLFWSILAGHELAGGGGGGRLNKKETEKNFGRIVELLLEYTQSPPLEVMAH